MIETDNIKEGKGDKKKGIGKKRKGSRASSRGTSRSRSSSKGSDEKADNEAEVVERQKNRRDSSASV